MISQEGEYLQLKNCTLKGEVEEWLYILEESMQQQLKNLCIRANNKYDLEDTQHTQWVMEYPCQVVLIIDGIWWTKLTEDFLNPANNLDLYQWYESIVIQVDDIQEIIRGKLT